MISKNERNQLNSQLEEFDKEYYDNMMEEEMKTQLFFRDKNRKKSTGLVKFGFKDFKLDHFYYWVIVMLSIFRLKKLAHKTRKYRKILFKKYIDKDMQVGFIVLFVIDVSQEMNGVISVLHQSLSL